MKLSCTVYPADIFHFIGLVGIIVLYINVFYFKGEILEDDIRSACTVSLSILSLRVYAIYAVAGTKNGLSAVLRCYSSKAPAELQRYCICYVNTVRVARSTLLNLNNVIPITDDYHSQNSRMQWW